jgi:hypothetical protein
LKYTFTVQLYTFTNAFICFVWQHYTKMWQGGYHLWIGHSQLTYSYLLNKEFQSECIFCNCPYPYFTYFWNAVILHPSKLDCLEIFNLCWTFLPMLTVILHYLHECDLYRKIWSLIFQLFIYIFIHFLYIYLLYIFNFLVRRMGC